MSHEAGGSDLVVTTGSTPISKLLFGSVSVNPGLILAGTMADVAITATGVDLASNWAVLISPMSALAAGVGIAYGRVSADNQITIRFDNPTILGITQGSVTIAYMAIK